MNIIKKIRPLYWKFPRLRPLLLGAYHVINPNYIKFIGWGMSTTHALLWDDSFDNQIFKESLSQIKEDFNFKDKTPVTITEEHLDSLAYRHWYISFATQYALTFADSEIINFVECGTADGHTAYFSLMKCINSSKNCNYHLYDSWDEMRIDRLTKKESRRAKQYKFNDIERTKKNLKKFEKIVTYHKGWLPESLYLKPDPPETISYLHIDINSSKTTIDVLEFFYPRLAKRAVIIFDDYGWSSFNETKIALDKFFSNKAGSFLKLPTGQAIFFI